MPGQSSLPGIPFQYYSLNSVVKASDRFFGIFFAAKGGESEIAFAAGTEAYPGCSDNVDLIEEFVKEGPESIPAGVLSQI